VRRADMIKQGITSDAERLKVLSSILTEIASKDKTYMNLLGTIASNLTQIATTQKDKEIKEQAALVKDMQGQAEEFLRRYTNVKQRNGTSDKVL